MLTTLNLKVGSILHDMELNIDHRVIYMNKDYLVTILINDSKGKIELNEWHLETVQYFIAKKEIAIRESKHDKVFDFDALSEKSKETYLRNKDIVETVGDIYGPCYFYLESKKPMKCRLDERNVGSLWYIADNRLVKATLNENRAGNHEFNGMSLRNYEEYKTKKKELVMEKAQEDQEIRCARRMGMQATLDDAVRVANQTAPNDDKAKNIRHNRKEESILVLEANSIGARLNTDDAPSLIPLKNEEPEPEALSEPESNEETGSMTFEEALQKIKQKM